VSGDVVADINLEACIAAHKFGASFDCTILMLQGALQGGQEQHHDVHLQGSKARTPPSEHRVWRDARP
jgi:hypothetical protein